jgi:hypothetical protein
MSAKVALAGAANTALVGVAAQQGAGETGTSLQQIDKNITYIRTTGRNVQERIHLTALMIMEHSFNHGDCSRALTLVQAMPKGMRRSLVVKWFGRFSPIAVNIVDRSPNDSSVRLRKHDSKKYVPYNLAGAKAVPWYTLEPEIMPDNAWDETVVNAKVISLATALENRLNDGKIADEAVERTRALVEMLKAA